jgi:hypothetical protein
MTYAFPKYGFGKSFKYAATVVAGYYTGYPAYHPHQNARTRSWATSGTEFGVVQYYAASGQLSDWQAVKCGKLILPEVDVESLNDVYLGLSEREGSQDLTFDWLRWGQWMELEARSMMSATQIGWMWIGFAYDALDVLRNSHLAETWRDNHSYSTVENTSGFASVKREILRRALGYTMAADDSGRDLFDAVMVIQPSNYGHVVPAAVLTVAQLCSVLTVRLAEYWLPSHGMDVAKLLQKAGDNNFFTVGSGRLIRNDKAATGDWKVIESKWFWIWRNVCLLAPSVLTGLVGSVTWANQPLTWHGPAVVGYDVDWISRQECEAGTPMIELPAFHSSTQLPVVPTIPEGVTTETVLLTRGGPADLLVWRKSDGTHNIVPALGPIGESAQSSRFKSIRKIANKTVNDSGIEDSAGAATREVAGQQ